MLATCHTAGCVNDGEPIEVGDLTDPDGAPVPVMCGPCGQPITDVT